jgi:hypothetical protein
VKVDSYGCSKCSQIFGRKWNAERHNERIHDNLATINDRKTKADSPIDPKTKPDFYKSKFNHFGPRSSTEKDDKLEEVFYKYFNIGHDYDTQPKIWKVFGQLSHPFEELEKQIDDNMEELKEKEKESLRDEDAEKLKADIICQIFFSCMRSYRPVKSMKETVEIYRSTKMMKKIEKYFAKSKNISPIEAKVIIESTIKNSAHFKNNIN